MRAWRQGNAARQKALVQAWRAENRDRWRETKRLQKRGRAAKVKGVVSPDDVTRIFRAQKGRCAYCRTRLETEGPGKYHLDHIIPLAAGGEHAASNLQAACPTCNVAKGARDPVEFAQTLGRLL